MENALDQLLAQPGIWRAGEHRSQTAVAGDRHTPTGFAELDAALPGGGLEAGSLAEVLHEHHGIGELRLLMPALARLSRQGRWIALIAPPYVPYAPGLTAQGIDLSRVLLVHPASRRDSLWSVEQALRAGTCAAVLAWPRHCDDRSLRRLQLAAEAGSSLGLLFRDATAAMESSPAALRLQLEHTAGGRLGVKLLKCRGGRCRQIELDPAPLAPVSRTGTASQAPTDTAEGPRERAVTPLPASDTSAAARQHPAGRNGNVPEPVNRPRAPVVPICRDGGGQQRPGQMDLPLPTPLRPGGRPQATLLPATDEGRLTRLWKRLR